MDFNILKSNLNKFKETIFYNFILIFLTAFITKNCILIFKKALKMKEINSSFLLLNIDTGYRYFWLLGLIILCYLLSIFKIKLKWNLVSKEIKLLVLVSALILTWSTVFSDFNYYENNWFLLDRLILLILCVLIFFKPSVIFLFILYFLYL